MKKLIIDNKTYEPYTEIIVNNDHYLCDGVVLPFNVIGEGVIEDYIPVPVTLKVEVPSEITMRQARLALLGAGKLASVSAAIISMPEPQKSKATIEWEYSSGVLRHNGFVSQLGTVLGLTEQQIDELFILASTL